MKFRDYDDPLNFGMWYLCMVIAGGMLLVTLFIAGLLIALGCTAIGPRCIETTNALLLQTIPQIWLVRIVALYIFGGIALNLILRVRQRVQAAKRQQELARAKAEKDLDQFIEKLKSIE